MMLIAYVGTDDVNHDLTVQTARECGASVIAAPASEPLSSGGFEARFFDLDHLHPEHRKEVMKELLARPSPSPAAIQSHNLADEEVGALHANGIIVCRKFEPEVVRRLCCMAASCRTAHDGGEGADSGCTQADPAELSASVRKLATNAHHVLKGIATGGDDHASGAMDRLIGEIQRLQRRIDNLRQLHSLRLDEIQRWLDRLRELVHSRRNP
jgi:hypothetical protein